MSWADSLRMVRQRHPAIAERMIDGLEAHDPLTCLKSVRQCRLADSPPFCQEESEPPPRLDGNSGPSGSWTRSFCGRRCGLASVTVPGHYCVPNTDFWFLRHWLPSPRPRLHALPFSVFLCRRLHLPLPLSMRICRCGRQ